jgi:hypothetical protein
MVRPLPEVLAWRAALVAAPFVVWFIWRAWAGRTGREMGATPWPWLFGAGCLLAGLSLVASVILHPDNRGERYVPGEVQADGHVSQGHFTPGARARQGEVDTGSPARTRSELLKTDPSHPVQVSPDREGSGP